MVTAEAASAAVPVKILRRSIPPRDAKGSRLVNETAMISSHDFLLGEKHRSAFRHKAGRQPQIASQQRKEVKRGRALSSDRIPGEDVSRAVELVEGILERRHAVLGDALRRPAFAVMHRAK